MSAASLSVSIEFHRRSEFGPLGRLTTQEEGFLLAKTIKKRGCGFFNWYDPQMCARLKAIIPGLLRGRNQLESEVLKLKKENRKALLLLVVVGDKHQLQSSLVSQLLPQLDLLPLFLLLLIMVATSQAVGMHLEPQVALQGYQLHSEGYFKVLEVLMLFGGLNAL
ncbi:hypothetical protein BUALT_Bualt19G0042000 [Buddleja alternifolia]|uniref:Uncharacterized protein n=1 Tax=Buddleja alternifolia TaxID=168488 RepID=A0AAV6VZU5_9LAMI|nr:hypothetical protein BUALT_Bualt19G0042000 [Buddleja alternifolia]